LRPDAVPPPTSARIEREEPAVKRHLIPALLLALTLPIVLSFHAALAHHAKAFLSKNRG